jgi:hypothetical protein
MYGPAAGIQANRQTGEGNGCYRQASRRNIPQGDIALPVITGNLDAADHIRYRNHCIGDQMPISSAGSIAESTSMPKIRTVPSTFVDWVAAVTHMCDCRTFLLDQSSTSHHGRLTTAETERILQ